MILITGGTGFIGRQLASDLLKKGLPVRLLVRDPEKARGFPGAEIVQGDLQDPESLEKACKGVDKVIHLAALISYTKPREELFRGNVQTTQNLLQACKKARKFIFASSVAVYGEAEFVDETSPLNPDTPYGESKLLAEKAVLESNIPATSLRLGPVYGPGGRIFTSLMKMLQKGFPVPKTGVFTSVIHVSDVSSAFQLALEKPPGVYNIAGPPVQFQELATLLASSLGKQPKLWPPWLVFLVARLAGKGRLVRILSSNRNYSIQKAKKELGFIPSKNLAEGIKEMAEWYKSRNP